MPTRSYASVSGCHKVNSVMKNFLRFACYLLLCFYLFPVEAASAGSSTITSVRSDGTILLNGRPFFPFGFVHETDANRDGDCFMSDITTIGNAGFNTIYSDFPEAARFSDPASPGCGTTSVPNTIFSTAQSKGIYFLPNTSWSLMPSLYNALNRQPGIMGWSVGDDINNLGPATVLEHTKYFKQIRGNKSQITVGPIGAHPAVINLADYVNTVDVLMIESYPVGNMYKNGFTTEEEQNIATYANVKNGLKQSSATTFIAIPQTFKYARGNAVDTPRYPTPSEFRNMLYAALIYGAKGAVMYTFFTHRVPILPLDAPALWDEAKSLKQDLFDKSSLTQVFMNGKLYVNGNGRTWYEPAKYSFWPPSGPGIFAGVWNYNKTPYVIVVSTFSDINTAQSATIPLPSEVVTLISSQQKVMRDLFPGDPRYGSGMTYDASAGSISGNVLGQAVHVYTFGSAGSTATPAIVPTAP